MFAQQGKSQPRTRVLRLMAIVVLLVVGGVGVASYFGTAAYRKREAILSKFGNAQANYERAFALHQQGKLAEAIEEYRAVLRVIPGHSYAHYNLGLALASQGDSAAAAESFRKARTFGQGDAENLTRSSIGPWPRSDVRRAMGMARTCIALLTQPSSLGNLRRAPQDFHP